MTVVIITQNFNGVIVIHNRANNCDHFLGPTSLQVLANLLMINGLKIKLSTLHTFCS